MDVNFTNLESLDRLVRHQIRVTQPDGKVYSGVVKDIGEISYLPYLSQWVRTVFFSGDGVVNISRDSSVEVLVRGVHE